MQKCMHHFGIKTFPGFRVPFGSSAFFTAHIKANSGFERASPRYSSAAFCCPTPCSAERLPRKQQNMNGIYIRISEIID